MVQFLSKPNLSIGGGSSCWRTTSRSLQASRASKCGKIPPHEQPCYFVAPFLNGRDKKGHRNLGATWLVRNGYFLTYSCDEIVLFSSVFSSNHVILFCLLIPLLIPLFSWVWSFWSTIWTEIHLITRPLPTQHKAALTEHGTYIHTQSVNQSSSQFKKCAT